MFSILNLSHLINDNDRNPNAYFAIKLKEIF